MVTKLCPGLWVRRQSLFRQVTQQRSWPELQDRECFLGSPDTIQWLLLGRLLSQTLEIQLRICPGLKPSRPSQRSRQGQQREITVVCAAQKSGAAGEPLSATLRWLIAVWSHKGRVLFQRVLLLVLGSILSLEIVTKHRVNIWLGCRCVC